MRTADYERWQQLDFVVGIKVELSNNHTCRGVKGEFVDICDELAGEYPKDFKFVGWHPHCRCHAVPILKTPEEMKADNERIMRGGEPSEGSVNEVKEMPQGFSAWVERNEDRMDKAKSKPYFINDNKEAVKSIVDRMPYSKEQVPAKIDLLTPKSFRPDSFDTEKKFRSLERELDYYLKGIKSIFGKDSVAYRSLETDAKAFAGSNIAMRDIIAMAKQKIKNINIFGKYGKNTIGGEIRETFRRWENMIIDTEGMEKIPAQWRSKFNDYIKRISKYDKNVALVHDYVTKDVEEVYRLMSGALNIYELSNSSNAIKYGLNRISMNTPSAIFTQMFEWYENGKCMPSKRFFDLFDDFVPLITHSIDKEQAGAFFNPVGKYVVFELDNSNFAKRMIKSQVHRKKIFYHEYGHAFANLRKGGNMEKDKNWLNILTEYKEYADSFSVSKLNHLDRLGGMSCDNNELVGELLDVLKALMTDKSRIDYCHSIEYFSKEENCVAEILAHASELYWMGNDIFRNNAPELYKAIINLYSKYV